MSTVDPELPLNKSLPESALILQRVNRSTRRALTKLALTTGRSKALLIEEALNHYCELLSGQIEAIEAGLQDADAGQFYSTQDILTDLEQVRVSRLPMD